MMRFTSSCIALALGATSVFAQTSISAQDATSFALTYGYPLLAFEKVRIVVDAVGANKWFHFRTLQTPDNKSVVKPNVDTLYSAMAYDLSHDDLLVSLPDDIPPEQFHLISFFDPFGTNYVNIGTQTTNASGVYRLQPRVAASPEPQVVSGPESQIKATLKTNSMYGFILIRWLVNNTNLDAIHSWQDETLNATSPVSARAPPLSALPRANSSLTPVENVLKLLTAFEDYTLPDDTTLAENVTATLAVAGISNGTYTAPASVDTTAANQTAIAEAVAAADASSAMTTLNNGWTVANASLIGIYGDNYAFRAAVASGGYLAIRAPNAIYPSWSNGTSATPLGGEFELGANESYVLTFSSQPPLTETGFWSVTAYQNNYLIPNNYSVYAITSERSNITYMDDTKQAFQILVQPADVRPPDNWTSNYLPGPAGGGTIALTLRLYDAQQSLLDGSWQYPQVSKRAAIVGSSSPSNTTGTAPSGTASTSTVSGGSSGTPASTAPSTTTPNPTGGAQMTRWDTGLSVMALAPVAVLMML